MRFSLLQSSFVDRVRSRSARNVPLSRTVRSRIRSNASLPRARSRARSFYSRWLLSIIPDAFLAHSLSTGSIHMAILSPIVHVRIREHSDSTSALLIRWLSSVSSLRSKLLRHSRSLRLGLSSCSQPRERARHVLPRGRSDTQNFLSHQIVCSCPTSNKSHHDHPTESRVGAK
jgi:hypothetical protein